MFTQPNPGPQHFRLDFEVFGRPAYALCCYSSADIYLGGVYHSTMEFQEALEIFCIV